MTELIQVTITAGSRDEAARIADALVERRLAACVLVVGPIRSTYHWKGEIERGEEWLLLAKTRCELFDPLRRAVLSIHSYDVPEIIATAITDGHPPYLDWLRGEVAEADE